MKRIEIYDPAMCCSTGVCGPSVDPDLVRMARDLEWLKKSGVKVFRYNLGQEPQAFVENLEVGRLLEEKGPEALPITIADKEVVKTGSYPTRVELEAWLVAGNISPESAHLLSSQIRELIAIGAAIAGNCEPCFKYHYDKARQLGVTKEEMIEAVEIGDAVKNTSSENTLALAERYLVGQSITLETKGGGCCGGSKDNDCC